MHTTTTQADFLENKRNKSRLIKALCNCFQEAGIHVKQAHADADRLIVTTALVAAQLETMWC